MQTITIHFTVTLLKNELARGIEFHPSVLCYLSAHVERSEQDHADVLLKQSAPVAGKVTGHVNRLSHTLSSNTAFCMALFGWRPDDHSGVNCRINLGTARFTLEEAESAHRASKPLERALIMHTTNPPEQKAVVAVTITSLELGGLHFDGKRFDAEAAAAELNDYYEQIRSIRDAMGETLRGTSNMDAPYDFSESGFTSGTAPMPFLAYALRELPKTNAAMWEAALSIVLARDGEDLHDYQRLGSDGKARTLAALVTLIPSYTDYTSDVVVRGGVREGMEQFGARYTGDCEDTGGLNAQVLEALCKHEFTLNTQSHKALRELQEIATQYVALRSLDVVKGAQVSDSVASYGAHLNANLISFAQLKAGLLRHPQGAKTVAELPWPAHMDEDTSKWPLLVAEGTGIYEPLGYTDKHLPAKGYVYNMRSLGNVKKPIGHERTEATPFFVASLIGTTGYFAQQGKRGIGYGTFFYTNGDADRPTRGTLYSNLTGDKTDAYGFLAFPKLSARIMEAVRESNAIAIPPLPLTLTRREHDPAKSHPELDRLVATVATMRRAAPSEHVAVPLYFRPYQLTPKAVGAIIADFERAPRVHKVSYHLERITDLHYGYRVMVHVNTRPA